MFRLGQSLVDLGQIDAGCQILSQVQIRFPEAEETFSALDAMNELQCQ
jgi:TolA-binding protein